MAIENVDTVDEHRSKIVRNKVYDCHLSQAGRQKAIKNTVPFAKHHFLQENLVPLWGITTQYVPLEKTVMCNLEYGRQMNRQKKNQKKTLI